MSYTEQLLGSIDARMAEVNEEITSLSGALLVLRTDAPVGPEPAAAPRKGRARSASRRASASRRRAAPSSAAPVASAPAPVASAAAPASSSATNGDAPTAKRQARRARRTNRKLDPETLESMLQGSGDGLSAVAIAKAASAGYNQVLELLRELERTGIVIRTGTRRTSLWRLITDEERIAARAAELAAR